MGCLTIISNRLQSGSLFSFSQKLLISSSSLTANNGVKNVYDTG
jgi:hypothetical protein